MRKGGRREEEQREAMKKGKGERRREKGEMKKEKGVGGRGEGWGRRRMKCWRKRGRG